MLHYNLCLLVSPVLISRTNGFWDNVNYVNKENIFFINNPTHEVWIENIKSIYNNIEKLNEVSLKGIDLVHSNYSLNKFNNYLQNKVKEHN